MRIRGRFLAVSSLAVLLLAPVYGLPSRPPDSWPPEGGSGNEEEPAEEPGYIGVSLAATPEGVVLAQVRPHGPAWEGGLRQGDRILSVDGTAVADARGFVEAVGAKLPGEVVRIEVIRDGETLVREVTVGTRPRVPGYIGVQPNGEPGPGVGVDGTTPNGPAERAGIRAGDRIVKVDGAAVRDVEHLVEIARALRPGQRVAVELLRDAESVTVELVAGRHPQGDQTMGFKPNDPLALSGERPDDATIEASIRRGIDYLLDEQKPDGSWEPVLEGHFLSQTSDNAIDALVMTALVGMGLRTQEGMDPERIGPAVDRGRRYLLDRLQSLPVSRRVNYGVWRYTYGSQFLIGELAHAADPAEREAVRAAAAGLLDTLYQMQLKKDGEARPPEETGFLGVAPVQEDESGAPGVAIGNVTKDGPAAKGGLRPGDRILAIGDMPIGFIDDLYDAVSMLRAGEEVDVRILRGEEEMTVAVALGARDRPLDTPVREEGGWAYYPLAAGNGFVTAAVIRALQQADAAGFDVPEETLRAAADNLDAQRVQNEGQAFSYLYRGGLRGSARMQDPRGSIGRIVVCELALFGEGRRTQENLQEAYRTFLLHRGELDKVRGFEGTHFPLLWMNAAYYWCFGHYYAAAGLDRLEDPDLRERAATTLLEVMVKAQAPDRGVWTDHPAMGDLYGTAMALRTFAAIRDGAASR